MGCNDIIVNWRTFSNTRRINRGSHNMFVRDQLRTIDFGLYPCVEYFVSIIHSLTVF